MKYCLKSVEVNSVSQLIVAAWYHLFILSVFSSFSLQVVYCACHINRNLVHVFSVPRYSGILAYTCSVLHHAFYPNDEETD